MNKNATHIHRIIVAMLANNPKNDHTFCDLFATYLRLFTIYFCRFRSDLTFNNAENVLFYQSRIF